MVYFDYFCGTKIETMENKFKLSQIINESDVMEVGNELKVVVTPFVMFKVLLWFDEVYYETEVTGYQAIERLIYEFKEQELSVLAN